MKRYGLTALMTCLIVSCLTASADNVRTWVAVGDDGMVGLASGYVMAVSQDSTQIVIQNLIGGSWSAAPGLLIILPEDLPVPSAPGTNEPFSIPGLEPGTWFASIKAFDEVPNYSALGNICRFVIEDKIAPAAILTLE